MDKEVLQAICKEYECNLLQAAAIYNMNDIVFSLKCIVSSLESMDRKIETISDNIDKIQAK